MLRGISDLTRFTIAATDGKLGSVRDLYFDDRSWGRPPPGERVHHYAGVSRASNRELDHVPVQLSGFVRPQTDIDEAVHVAHEVAAG
jgi:hypothetical protein